MKKKIYLAAGVCIFTLSCGVSYKFIQHEYRQNEKINQLNAEVKSLSSELESMTVDVVFPEDTYNYLTIGYSITLHDTCNFWWNECGMTVSKKEEDYKYLLEYITDRVSDQCEIIAAEFLNLNYRNFF